MDLPRAVEEALVPISALQHHLYCPRQCALIHVEGLWAEDAATAEGRLLHAKVDAARGEGRPGIRIARGLQLRSLALGLAGRADVVEFRPNPFPVEYKRGSPKPHRADEVQLCAQALCLEEMLGCSVPDGALFYAKTRRRQPVPFDTGLRDLTVQVAGEVRANIRDGRTPAPVLGPGCRRCSMKDLCQPEVLGRRRRIADWFARQIDAER